jgi:hypothetical protein
MRLGAEPDQDEEWPVIRAFIDVTGRSIARLWSRDRALAAFVNARGTPSPTATSCPIKNRPNLVPLARVARPHTIGPGQPARLEERTSSWSLRIRASSGVATISNNDFVVVRVSEADYPPRERLDAWREIYRRTLQRLDIEPFRSGISMPKRPCCVAPVLAGHLPQL